jgi:hypothetical protein
MVKYKQIHVCDMCRKPIDVSGEHVDLELCISCGMLLMQKHLTNGCSLWVNNVCVLQNKEDRE